MKILFIAGPTRSGSTFVSKVLNEFDGVASVGEVISLDVAFQSCRLQALGGARTKRFTPDDAGETAARRFSGLCGCGLPLTECSIWSGVERAVFGDPPDYSPWSWTASRPSPTQIVRTGAKNWPVHQHDALANVAQTIYAELARRTGARVLVDESKTPLYGHFLCAQPWADVVPVRLVRDPRATAASWSRPKRYPGILGESFPTHPAPVSAINWLKRVVLADHIFNDDGPVVRFEDFLDDPMAIARDLLTLTGIETVPPAPGPLRSVHFRENHIIASNPDKFARGEVGIRRTNDARKIPWRSSAVVTGMTLPLLRRYRYPLTRS
jgi:hypothetical protein